MSAWRSNAWLAILGAALVGLAALGAEGLAGAAADVYVRLPMLEPVFRADHERQVRALHPLVAGLGLFVLAGYVLASRRGLALWPWLLSPGTRGAGHDRLRTSAAAIAVLYAAGFVPVRANRDVLRERDLRGLSVVDRRQRLYGVHTPEPDYGPVEAFRRASGGEGALLLVRRGPEVSFDDVFLAAYLFPQRVFVRHVPTCAPDAATALLAERPSVRWIEWLCGDGRFAPAPVPPR